MDFSMGWENAGANAEKSGAARLIPGGVPLGLALIAPLCFPFSLKSVVWMPIRAKVGGRDEEGRLCEQLQHRGQPRFWGSTLSFSYFANLSMANLLLTSHSFFCPCQHRHPEAMSQQTAPPSFSLTLSGWYHWLAHRSWRRIIRFGWVK